MSTEVGVLIGVLLAAVAVFFVTRPFRERTQESSRDDTALDDLAAQREAAYQVLRDLDNDFQTGKLAEDDYRPLRVQALAQAAEIVAQMDAYERRRTEDGRRKTEGERRTKVAKRVQRRRAMSSRPSAFCPKCGSPRAEDDAFCSKCGAALNREDLAGLGDPQGVERHD